jgi:DNA-directed RNA polymerase specialized sigma24 family protein
VEVATIDPASRIDDLYRAHRRRLARLAFLLTGSADVADELAHDAFVRLWPNLGSVRDPAAYLTTTVTNLARGHLRRISVERRHAPVPPGPALPPDVDEVWSQLWTLSERERAALVLRFYADLDVAGVADAMGCRLGTAKSLIHRGLAHLKEVLEP